VEVWQTSNLRQLRLSEEKKERRRKKKKKPQDENMMVCPIPQGDHKTAFLVFLRFLFTARLLKRFRTFLF